MRILFYVVVVVRAGRDRLARPLLFIRHKFKCLLSIKERKTKIDVSVISLTLLSAANVPVSALVARSLLRTACLCVLERASVASPLVGRQHGFLYFTFREAGFSRTSLWQQVCKRAEGGISAVYSKY